MKLTFAIDPGALGTHAQLLRDLSGSTAAAEGYLADHLSLGLVDTSLLFWKAGDAAGQVRDSINVLIADLRVALDLSAEELDATAQRSIELDDSIEAELDAAFPDAEVCRPKTLASALTVYMVPNKPEAYLKAPADGTCVDLVSTVLTTDWFSPSTVIAEILGLVFKWNYLEEITKYLSGDWNSMFRVSSVMQNLSRYTSDGHAAGVSYAMSKTANSWHGNSGDAANEFFTEMATLLRNAAAEISLCGPEFETVARGMQDTADAVAGLFAKIMDAAIAAAVLAIAGTATFETIVGPILGYLGAAGTLVYMAWLADQAWEVLQAALLFFDLLGAAVGGVQQFLIDSPDLPRPQPYDNPEV